MASGNLTTPSPAEAGNPQTLTIFAGADAFGCDLKSALVAHLRALPGVQVVDLGVDKYYSIAARVGRHVSTALAAGDSTRGLLACGTGVGVAMFANKFPRVYAATCATVGDAVNTRSINDCNVLAVGGMGTSVDDGVKILEAWLNTPFKAPCPASGGEPWKEDIQEFLDNAVAEMAQIPNPQVCHNFGLNFPRWNDMVNVVTATPENEKRKRRIPGKGTPNKRWDKDMDAFLIPFLVDQANVGNRSEKLFKRSAFVAAAEQVSKKFGVDMLAENVENHLTWIKKKFGELMKARKLNGVIWDEEKKMLIMEPKTYNAYIPGRSYMKKYINKPIEFYEELRLIYGEDEEAAAGERMKSGGNGHVGENVDIDNDIDAEDEKHANPTNSSGVEPHTQPIPSPAPTTSATSRRSNQSGSKRPREEPYENVVNKLYDGMNVLAESISKGPEHWSDKLAKAVMELDGFTDQILSNALDELIGSETKARAFIIKTPRMRKDWMKDFAKRHVWIQQATMRMHGGAS